MAAAAADEVVEGEGEGEGAASNRFLLRPDMTAIAETQRPLAGRGGSQRKLAHVRLEEYSGAGTAEQ